MSQRNRWLFLLYRSIMKRYPYNLITKNGTVGLIEVSRGGKPERCFLPAGMLGDETLTDEQIDTGIQYGLPFAEFVKIPADFPARLETALHAAGIWTVEDLSKQAQLVVNTLQAAYRIELSKLIKAANEYESRDKDAVIQPAEPRQKKTKGVKNG
jgi:hypothetical protein